MKQISPAALKEVGKYFIRKEKYIDKNSQELLGTLEIKDQICKNTGMAVARCNAILDTLIDVITYYIATGYAVVLDDFIKISLRNDFLPEEYRKAKKKTIIETLQPKIIQPRVKIDQLMQEVGKRLNDKYCTDATLKMFYDVFRQIITTNILQGKKIKINSLGVWYLTLAKKKLDDQMQITKNDRKVCRLQTKHSQALNLKICVQSKEIRRDFLWAKKQKFITKKELIEWEKLERAVTDCKIFEIRRRKYAKGLIKAKHQLEEALLLKQLKDRGITDYQYQKPKFAQMMRCTVTASFKDQINKVPLSVLPININELQKGIVKNYNEILNKQKSNNQ